MVAVSDTLGIWTRVKRAPQAVGVVTRRFPLPVAAGALGAVAGAIMLHPSISSDARDSAGVALMACWMGVSLLLAATLFVERQRGWTPTEPLVGPRRWLVRLAPVVALALVGMAFVGLHDQPLEWRVIRFALWMLAVHGLVAIAPVLPAPDDAGRSRAGDFRAFNVLLFTRAFSGLVLTHVLLGGLAFALLALQKLFDVHVADWVFKGLWFVLLGVGNTFYVLAGIPARWDRLAGSLRSPPLLDALARYVLLPLSALYLVILYAYSARLIWLHDWPRGWVAAPVIVFAAMGLLTVSLFGPDGERGAPLVRAYCKAFFVALCPLVVLLLLAIERRTREYGLTEARCLVYAVALFLGFLGPYFVFSRRKRLATIPIALAVIALASSVGPLSAASLSLRSQTGRLRELFARTHLLEGPLASGIVHPIAARDERQLNAILTFLEARQRMDVVATLGGPRCAPCAEWRAVWPTPGSVMAALGLHYRRWDDLADDDTTYSTAATGAVATTGFDWLVDVICSGGTCTIRGDQTEWSLGLDPDGLGVAKSGELLGRVPLAELVAKARAAAGAGPPRELPLAALTLDGTLRRAGSAWGLIFDWRRKA